MKETDMKETDMKETDMKETDITEAKILTHVDHTLLAQTATWEEIRQILDDAIYFHTASACIPPSYVKRAKEYVGDRLPICTVIGFPNGYQTTKVKVFETEDALLNGADEIDMVINLGDAKEYAQAKLLEEIKAVKEACGAKILKVIIETCLLSEEEKIMMCHIVSEAGADYIKTSTGFSKAGATVADVTLLRHTVSPETKVKAAGGIADFSDARQMLLHGADRLGTSRLVKLAKMNIGGNNAGEQKN